MKDLLIEELNKYSYKVGHDFKLKHIPLINDDTPFKPKDIHFTLPFMSTYRRIIIFYLLIFVSGILFLSRSIEYQVIQQDTYNQLAKQNYIRRVSIMPERGVVFDTKNKLLVRNEPAFSLELNTNICSLNWQNFTYCHYVVARVSKLVPMDIEQISKAIKEKKAFITLATGLAKDDILPIEANINQYPGLSIITSPKRDYLFKDVFAHLIGYVGSGATSYPSITGKSGIEKSYDNVLAGTSGYQIIKASSRGDVYEAISQVEPVAGKDVSLFIDLNLQLKAYELLKKHVDSGKAIAGAIVAQDPNTGGIITLVSYPSFNPEKLSYGISSSELQALNNNPGAPFYNRVISATYPPGSTFKIITASAALMEKVVTEHTSIFDAGYIKIGAYRFNNWNLGGHGFVDMRRALQVSNDTYFYTVGGGYGNISGLGIVKLANWAKKFGIGEKSGIDIPGEVGGFMPDGTHKEWYLGDTYITAIGQGDVLSTPLQVNNITAYFANGGYLYKPRVVKSIAGVSDIGPEILASRLVDNPTYTIIREGLKLAVQSGGTAYPLFDFSTKHPGIELAGKTGTSEYISPTGEPKTHAWFTVFGPYDNSSIALTIFLEGGGAGSDDAAPMARTLLDEWFSSDSNK